MEAAHHDQILRAFVFFRQFIGALCRKRLDRKGDHVRIQRIRQRFDPLIVKNKFMTGGSQFLDQCKNQRLQGILSFAVHHIHFYKSDLHIRFPIPYSG